MIDYTQLANEAKARAADEPRSEAHQILLFGKSPTEEMAESIESLADALLACQRERDELSTAIWGEPQPSMSIEETRRQAVDQRVAFEAMDGSDPVFEALRAKIADLEAEVAMLQAWKSNCTEHAQPSKIAHIAMCERCRAVYEEYRKELALQNHDEAK